MDSNYKSYADRVTTGTPSVLGYKLNPFTLGHSLLLKASQNSFITGAYNGCTNVNVIAQALVDNAPAILTDFI